MNESSKKIASLIFNLSRISPGIRNKVLSTQSRLIAFAVGHLLLEGYCATSERCITGNPLLALVQTWEALVCCNLSR